MKRLIHCILFLIGSHGLLAYGNDVPQDVYLQWEVLYNESIRENVRNSDDLAMNVESIIGLEILIAAKGSALESRFGHTFLRLVDNDDNVLNDWVIGFAADINEPKLSAVKGLNGSYKVVLTVMPFFEVLSEYSINQNRAIDRYPLVLEAKDLQEFRDLLKSKLKKKEEQPYTFLNNNCANLMISLFIEAGWPHFSNGKRFPLGVSKWALRSHLSPFPALRIESKKNRVQSAVLKFRNSNELSQLSIGDMNALLILQEDLDENVRQNLKNELKSKNEIPSLSSAFEIERLPNLVYQLCSSTSCISDQLRAFFSFWPESFTKLELRQYVLKGYKSFISNRDLQFTAYKKHFEKIISLLNQSIE